MRLLHRGVGRIESQTHVWYVPRRDIVQPRHLEVGSVECGQHEEHVSQCEIFRPEPLWGPLGPFTGGQNGHVCKLDWKNIGKGVREQPPRIEAEGGVLHDNPTSIRSRES